MTRAFLGESATDTPPTIADAITGHEYDGFPLQEMTLVNMLKHGEEGSLCNYYWPYEVRSITDKGIHFFKRGTLVMDGTTEVEAIGKPTMVDASSARAFKLVYDAVNHKNKTKMAEYVQSRGLFLWCMSELVWPNVGFGG